MCVRLSDAEGLTVSAKSLSRGEALFSATSLVLVTCFLVAVGLGLVPVHLETVIRNPRWRLFVEVCVLRAWPLWIATLIVALVVYCLVRRVTLGRVALPRGARRIVLCVNALVMVPTAVAFDFFAREAAGAVSRLWYWQVAFAIFLGGIAVLIIGLKLATRWELAEKADADAA